jgi:hypothetical protein
MSVAQGGHRELDGENLSEELGVAEEERLELAGVRKR